MDKKLLSIEVEKNINRSKEWLNFKSNNWETNEDPRFADWKNRNFSIKKHSLVFKEIPLFKEVPFQKISL